MEKRFRENEYRRFHNSDGSPRAGDMMARLSPYDRYNNYYHFNTRTIPSFRGYVPPGKNIDYQPSFRQGGYQPSNRFQNIKNLISRSPMSDYFARHANEPDGFARNTVDSNITKIPRSFNDIGSSIKAPDFHQFF